MAGVAVLHSAESATRSFVIAPSIPDLVSTPVNRPAAKIVVTIIIAAAPWLVRRSRCSWEFG